MIRSAELENRKTARFMLDDVWKLLIKLVIKTVNRDAQQTVTVK